MPPVDDHPVHPSTIQKADAKYGCHNRAPYKSHYYAPDRIYRPDDTFYIVLKKVDYEMSIDCQYTKTGHQLAFVDGDPMCEGCTWKR